MPVPQGTVHVINDSTTPPSELGAGTLDANGHASVSVDTTSIAPGVYNLHVHYDGGGVVQPSDSGPFQVEVDPPVSLPSSVHIIAAAPNPVNQGQALVFSIQVTQP